MKASEGRMETQKKTEESNNINPNNNAHVGGGRDGDTEEFSEGELAQFVEQTWSQNGDPNSPWARLVSVNQDYANIELKENEVTLGRADVVRANGEEDMHVSKIHCKIWASAETGQCYLTNLSVNGTVVQGQPIEKEKHFSLHHGDEVCLGPRTSGCPLFVFQMLKRVHHGHQKRPIEIEADSGSKPTTDDAGNGPGPKKPKMMESLDTFKCSICLNVWHDVISVTPCLHSFCNACFSDWYRKSCRDRNECKCPQCRGSVSSVSRNHTLRSLVEDLLKEDPSLGRSPQDIIELEKKSLFKGGTESQFQFGRNRSNWLSDERDEPDSLDAIWVGDDMQNSATLTSDEEDEEDEVEEYGCVQCAPLVGLFQCLPGQDHLVCVSCGRTYPERNDLQNVAQKCQVCSKSYCRSYFESQELVHPDFQSCPKILPLNQRVVLEMPTRTHHGNNYEQEVTRRYIVEQGLSVQSVLRDWLGRLDSGEADQPPFFVLFQTRVNSVSSVCDFCADEVFSHLLDKFRTFVPRTELPPDAAGRPDCWYGYECRTQHHKEAHARKLNHVCEPSRPSNRRSTAVHM
ncbi:unnamed protein product [Calypogeia fissa]